MSEFTMDRLWESLKMQNTLEILDNYLEREVGENGFKPRLCGFAEEAKSKRKRAYEKRINCTQDNGQ